VRQATVFPILRTCFFGGFSPRIFEEKLASIINSVRRGSSLVAANADRADRDAASLGHFRDGAHTGPGAGRIGS
jgi:hypothetical protein